MPDCISDARNPEGMVELHLITVPMPSNMYWLLPIKTSPVIRHHRRMGRIR
ncbi:hypothetical protein SynBIOSE41_03127 [Synechococcus sp. BIOS-E4-1]|nr:hypothetical protein SynBIOSE41_03127 [Synechococcus sp. BIOS-E4-1]